MTIDINNDTRSLAIITGACGGMGRVCAQLLGRDYQLALVDMNAEKLEHVAALLRADGFSVPLTMVVDISKAAEVAALAERVKATAPFGALVHTAGLSPALAAWEPILRVNLVGTVLLLDALLPLATTNSVAVCIASVAGHFAVPDTELNAILDAPLAPDLLQRMEPLLQRAVVPGDVYGLASPAYSFSKYAVLRLCEQRAKQWAERGARIVSLSPGMIATPMGNKELSDNVLAAGMFDQVPNKRIGTPLDIANAVEFLCSPRARYINGCDLKVDYGVVATIRHAANSG
ncbi:MAG: SDR family oxidoreductase [Spongiibacteraceae bacterium]